MSDERELQRELTRAALTALDGRAFALAGSGAIREHGIVDRATQDVDLFTNDLDPAAFDAAVDALAGDLTRSGFDVDQVRRSQQFAQLRITTGDGRSVDMDLAVDWREREPVTLAVGPVLSLSDAVGSKLNALYTRAEARDYLDVDANRASGHFTDQQLVDAAAERDAGFERTMFASQLDQVQRIRPERVARYGVDAEQLDAIKQRFTEWASQLREPEAALATPPLDPELQKIVELHRRDYPISATEIRPPSSPPQGRNYQPPSTDARAQQHGLGEYR